MLRDKIRKKAGREISPSLALIDSQSVKITRLGCENRGIDGGKKINGRKRHIIFVGITEHDLSEDKKVIVLVNYSPTDKEAELTLQNGWHIEKAIYGNLPLKSSVKLNANDACVLQLGKD